MADIYTEAYAKVIDELKKEGKKINACSVAIKMKKLGCEMPIVGIVNSNVEVNVTRWKGGSRIIIRKSKNFNKEVE